MNKILLGTALLLAASPALARTLTPEEAMARATTDTPAKMRPFCNASPVLTLTGKYGDLTTYYIYSTGASALILGAYDLSRPVLAYLARHACNSRHAAAAADDLVARTVRQTNRIRRAAPR